MSMTKVIEIDGKQVAFKASAAIPRIYRVRYGRDIFKDLIKLDKELKENSEEDNGLTMCSLEAFENIAYLMAKHADPSIPDTAEEWLEEFSVFSIYQVLPEIISLWGVNLETQSEAKKNGMPSTGKCRRRSSCSAVCSLGSPSGISTCSQWGSSMICISRATMIMRTMRRWQRSAISIYFNHFPATFERLLKPWRPLRITWYS